MASIRKIPSNGKTVLLRSMAWPRMQTKPGPTPAQASIGSGICCLLLQRAHCAPVCFPTATGQISRSCSATTHPTTSSSKHILSSQEYKRSEASLKPPKDPSFSSATGWVELSLRGPLHSLRLRYQTRSLIITLSISQLSESCSWALHIMG